MQAPGALIRDNTVLLFSDKFLGSISNMFGGKVDSDGDGIPDEEDDDDDNDGIPDSQGLLSKGKLTSNRSGPRQIDF